MNEQNKVKAMGVTSLLSLSGATDFIRGILDKANLTDTKNYTVC